MSLDELSLTIDRLYSAALDPKLWGEALRAVEEFTGSAGAVISFVAMHRDAPGTAPAVRFTVEQCQEYVRDYMAMCRRTQFGRQNPEHDDSDSPFIDEAGMSREPAYAWQEQQGVRCYLASQVSESAEHMAGLELQRTRAHGHTQAGDIDRLALVKPHVARALEIAHRLGTLASHECFSQAVIGNLPEGVVALSADGRVVFANAAAEAMFAAGDALLLRDGKLTAKRRTAGAQLARLVANAVVVSRRADHRIGGWIKIERASRLPYALFLTPLRCEAMADAFGGAAVLVVIHDPERKPCMSSTVLAELFGLTTAEARLARAIGGGQDLASVAELMGISMGTARAHLRAIFAKLGITRQSDLVRLLGTLTSLGT